MTRFASDHAAARLLAGLLFVMAVLLGLHALVELDWGLYFGAVFFAVLGMATLVGGERR